MKPPKCIDCALGRDFSPQRNNEPGWGNPDAKLVILIECAAQFTAEKLLMWLLMKNSLGENDVWVEYGFKCELQKKLKKKQEAVCFRICWTSHPRPAVYDETRQVVIMGALTSEFLVETKLQDLESGRRDPVSGAWLCHNLNYLLMSPGECVMTWRVLFKAAEAAGLSPKMRTDIPIFKFPTKKLH